jgi:NAD(P)-dependent dehydrogenase (short-subunit alcohol dehydrogenase family)
VADINLANAEEAVAELISAGGDAIAVKCDVTVWEDQVATFEAAIEKYGRLDVVVANAGVMEAGRFVGAPLGADGKPVKPNLTTLDINLTGALYSACASRSRCDDISS